MLCKKCGKDIPVSGSFCPYCGSAINYAGANDETAAFTPVSDPLETPIDESAWEAARQDDLKINSLMDDAEISSEEASIPKRSASPAPKTTYFEQPEPEKKPYKKPSKGKKGAVIAIVSILIIALIGAGVWYALSNRPDENLTLAEKYMDKGRFEDALEAYQNALTEAKDPTDIQLQISLLNDYLTAKNNMEQGEYAQALALLNSLKDRISDKTSPLYDAVEDLIDQTTNQQSNSQFDSDIADAANSIAEKKFDRAAAILDTLEADTTLTADQKKQVAKLRSELTEAQSSEERQQQGEEDKKKKKQSFLDRIEKLEENDKKITNAEDTTKALEATATSFEAWDMLLADVYDYLETTLSAEAYETEEESYKTWVKERDEAAENAAKDTEDEIAAELAKASLKQSYTKTRCYKVMDLM